MKRALLLMPILFAAGVVYTSAQQLRRIPLQKSLKRVELQSPTTWEKRSRGVDPRTKKEIFYDPKPRIEVADAQAGKYYFKWIGLDGKEKVIIYQRPDCVDVIVTARATRSASGYEYEYTVQSLKTSGDYLNSFAVQNFSASISPRRPAKVNHVFIGDMSPGGPFKEGNWINFAPLPPHPKVQPGQMVKFKLYSSAPPGLVECRVEGGDFVTRGVGEGVPEELQGLPSRDDAMPHGFTIGPVDKIKTMSQGDKQAYLLKILPECQRQGWITTQVSQSYEQALKRGDLQSVLGRLANDLKASAITTEVFAVIDGLK